MQALPCIRRRERRVDGWSSCADFPDSRARPAPSNAAAAPLRAPTFHARDDLARELRQPTCVGQRRTRSTARARSCDLTSESSRRRYALARRSSGTVASAPACSSIAGFEAARRARGKHRQLAERPPKLVHLQLSRSRAPLRSAREVLECEVLDEPSKLVGQSKQRSRVRWPRGSTAREHA